MGDCNMLCKRNSCNIQSLWFAGNMYFWHISLYCIIVKMFFICQWTHIFFSFFSFGFVHFYIFENVIYLRKLQIWDTLKERRHQRHHDTFMALKLMLQILNLSSHFQDIFIPLFGVWYKNVFLLNIRLDVDGHFNSKQTYMELCNKLTCRGTLDVTLSVKKLQCCLSEPCLVGNCWLCWCCCWLHDMKLLRDCDDRNG